MELSHFCALPEDSWEGEDEVKRCWKPIEGYRCASLMQKCHFYRIREWFRVEGTLKTLIPPLPWAGTASTGLGSPCWWEVPSLVHSVTWGRAVVVFSTHSQQLQNQLLLDSAGIESAALRHFSFRFVPSWPWVGFAVETNSWFNPRLS